jgi:hypothetical protein
MRPAFILKQINKYEQQIQAISCDRKDIEQ